jgi:hypothetical protein
MPLNCHKISSNVGLRKKNWLGLVFFTIDDQFREAAGSQSLMQRNRKKDLSEIFIFKCLLHYLQIDHEGMVT